MSIVRTAANRMAQSQLPEEAELTLNSSILSRPLPTVARPARLVILVNESKHFLSHRLDAAVAAVQAGFDVHLITRLMHDRSAIEWHGIHVHTIDFPRTLRNPITEFRTLRTLHRLYRRLQPDLLHHFSAKAILLGSLAARSARVKHVVNTFTGLGAAFTGTGWRSAARRGVANCCLKPLLRSHGWRVTFQNSEDMQQLVQAGLVRASQCKVIFGSGVDPTTFVPRDEPLGSPVVMLAARMIWSKGIAEFVRAASLLKQTATDARFVLVGDTDAGSRDAVPEEQLRSWDADGVIEWWGPRTDMPQTIGQASVVVLPTFYGEGLPKVLLEAAACGKPVIATDVRGCREIVRDGSNGSLIPTHDVESLASAMWRMLHQPEQRRAMGAVGREMVLHRFTAQRVAEQTLDVYWNMLDLPGTPNRRATAPDDMSLCRSQVMN